MIAVVIDAIAWLLAGSVCLRLSWPRVDARGHAAAAAMLCALTGLFVAIGMGLPTWCNGVAVAAAVLAFFAIVSALDPLPGVDHPDDEGGSHVSAPEPPPSPGGDGGAGSEPDWWPEFEREFRSWAADRASRPRALAHHD